MYERDTYDFVARTHIRIKRSGNPLDREAKKANDAGLGSRKSHL
jgi:hypothetical protein